MIELHVLVSTFQLLGKINPQQGHMAYSCILEGSTQKGSLFQASACLWKGWGFSLSGRYLKGP